MKADLNWEEVQLFHDEGNSQRDIVLKYGCSFTSIQKARKMGLFKSRSHSEGSKMGWKRYPWKHTEKTKKKISKIRIRWSEYQKLSIVERESLILGIKEKVE